MLIVIFLTQGYFTDGLAPDLKNLLKFAEEAGLDVEAAKKFTSDKTNQKKAFDRAIYWSAQGVSGM